MAGLGSGTSFAMASLLAKVVYTQGVSPLAYTVAGSLLALPLLLPWWRGGGWRDSLPAGLAGALSMLLYNIALARLSLSIAVIFAYTFPAFAILLVWLVRKRPPSQWQVIACVLSLGGIAVVAGNPGDWAGSFDLIGVLCATAGAVTHAAYGLYGEKLSDAGGARAVLLASVLTVLIPILIVPGEIVSGLVVSPTMWGLFAVSAVIARIVPLWLFSTGSRLAGAGPASMMATIELPISLMVGVLLLHDYLSPLQWAGTGAVVLAIWLSRLSTRSERANRTVIEAAIPRSGEGTKN